MNKFEKYFKEEKCDKHYHQYYRYYDPIIGDIQIDSVLDIGVCWGDSLRAWQKIWPDALVEGIDLLREYDLSLEDKFKIYNIDSTNKNLADTVVSKEYDIIIDDGNHHWKSQLSTFENYYQKAKKFYVIEDVLGEYSLDRLTQFLPSDIMERSIVFESKAHSRTFRFHQKTIHDHYRIMFIDKTW
jgi:hypothetical protein